MTGDDPLTPGQPEAVARAFLDARRAARALDTYPGVVPDALGVAYRIQDLALDSDDRTVAGWKVGRIHGAMADRFGADRLAGPIFAPSIVTVESGDEVPDMPIFEGGFGAAEAEFLLRIGKAVPSGMTDVTPEQARNWIDAVHIGIEIASSPFGGINDLGPAVTVSDYGNNNGLVVGPAIADWRSGAFEDWPVELSIDGETAGTGRAAAMPDGVFGAAAFLFSLLARRGRPLVPGQWISSGAITGVHRVSPGARIDARFGPDFRLACRIGIARPAAP